MKITLKTKNIPKNRIDLKDRSDDNEKIGIKRELKKGA
jgi:hypothetical protein